MDSIRENRTPEDVAREIKMMFDEDIDEELCVVLVEGSDDVKFMEDILEENVECVESPCGGKHGLNELIENPLIQKKEVLAIRDKDYMDIEVLPDRMFVYDGCCLETMILSNLDVAEKFYKFYQGNLEKAYYIINAMRQLAPYSVLRKKNELECLGINFEKVGFGDLVAENGMELIKLFERVKQSERFCLCKEEADNIKDVDLWDITNGHDLYTYLGILSKCGKKTLGKDGVKEVLLAIYRKTDFKTTKLYQSILLYQQKNRLKFVNA